MPVWQVLAITALYVGGLFGLAWRGDRTARKGGPHWRRPELIYGLALGVYCTSWTYFGAVGSAAGSGLSFLPIYIGPVLLFVFWPRLITRVADISKRESITSLSDFLASRYGHSRGLAALATVALTVGALPYIALQLKSVGMSFEALTQTEAAVYDAPTVGTVLTSALALAIFAILFGTRHADATRANHGLMYVIAFEAVFKLVALLVVALLAIFQINQTGSWDGAFARQHFHPSSITLTFVSNTFLAMAAILCLPRQFHVAIIERQSASEFRSARWIFPSYLLLTCLAVAPITLAGLFILPDDVPADLFVLALPEKAGLGWLAVIIFLGGFSAATGMVIVAAIALSTMITNDLVVPMLLRLRAFSGVQQNIGDRLLTIRRTVIFLLLISSFFFYHLVRDSEGLMRVGLLSFAGAAQLFPALVGALYWRRAHRDGAVAGISGGVLIWLYTLIAPEAFGADWMSTFILPPTNLFGTGGGDVITHGVIWSLGFNCLLFFIFSLRGKERLRDRVQANVFTDEGHGQATGRPQKIAVEGVAVSDLKALASRFLKPSAVDNAFSGFSNSTGVDITPSAPADWRLVQKTERLLSSALGSSSARVVLGSAITKSDVSLNELLAILDEKSHARRFDRHLLQATLENISLGVSVVDGDQKLVAWNTAYAEMFELPDDLLRVGRPIADIIRINAERGEFGPGAIEDHVEKRLGHIKAGKPHIYERVRRNGMVLKTIGNPMPGGGYVSTFTDITEDKQIELQLRDSKEMLEQRVAERTSALEELTYELDQARRDAEGANVSKTRFLAAASHDLLQPLNAARLYLGALQQILPSDTTDAQEVAEKVDKSIQSADQLLRGLLDISKLDHGVRPAAPRPISVNAVLADVFDEAEPIAEAAGLTLRISPTRLGVVADPDFLKSIVRNFVSNALRYTHSGGVLIGARRRGDRVRIEVWDTGIGVPQDKQGLIFEEFQRLEDADRHGVRGAGLGLAIARRMSKLMNAQIGLKSNPGMGSVFFVELPRSGVESDQKRQISPETGGHRKLQGLRVLCVDDETAILDGMGALLKSWGCEPILARSGEEAEELFRTSTVDFVFLDHQLSGDENGFAVKERLETLNGAPIRAAMLTADRSEQTQENAKTVGMPVFHKPVSPQTIYAFLAILPKAAE